jgi:hypothetical protein
MDEVDAGKGEWFNRTEDDVGGSLQVWVDDMHLVGPSNRV